jgi:hypothetical protein
MKTSLALLGSAALFNLGYAQVNPDDELVSVYEFVRHGSRAPYGQARFNATQVSWPIGHGELTPVGQRSHYLIGAELRKRYVDNQNFLNETFNPMEVRVFADGYNRTIASGFSQMLGLYPADTGYKLW